MHWLPWLFLVGVAGVAAGVVVAVAYWRWLRPWHLRWGATREEVARPMPGDDFVNRPSFNATRAVTVAARPEHIWPWLLQLGYQRAGFYSYDWIDNRRAPSAERIIPELQQMAVGDRVPLGRRTFILVKAVEPRRFLVWGSPDQESSHAWTWVWGLYPVDDERTRLITRLRVRYNWRSPVVLLDLLIFDFGDFVMMRKCLLGIKRRAEALARAETA